MNTKKKKTNNKNFCIFNFYFEILFVIVDFFFYLYFYPTNMKRKNTTKNSLDLEKSKVSYWQTVPDKHYYDAILKFYSSVVYVCVFFEQKLHPRNDKGEPEYAIPLQSIIKSGFENICVTSLIQDISFLIKPSVEITVRSDGNDGDGSGVISKIVITHGLKDVPLEKKVIPRSLILASKQRIETNLRKYVNNYGQNWKERLQIDSNAIESTALFGNATLDTPFDPATFIDDIKSLGFYKDQIVNDGILKIAKKPAIYSDASSALNPKITSLLADYWKVTTNEVKLYKHQAAAIKHIENGYSVIVSTSTSSGKSLIYQIPVLTALYDSFVDPSITKPSALFLFPTKALAQDQLSSFKKLSSLLFDSSYCKAETYDGDTAYEDREDVHLNGDVLFSNPDMIHANILPKWKEWEGFLKRLRFIVIDELHTYSRMFGAHVAFTFRRLKRICNEIGNFQVQIISCSATISHPKEMMESFFALNESEIQVVGPEDDGSPCGERHMVVWNSPVTNPNSQAYNRAHPIHDAVFLLVELLLKGSRVLAFCKIRRSCELLLKAVHEELEKRGLSRLKNRVMSYRGGYSVQDRRNIESRMFSGELSGIIATNALELGIDIGFLDAVLVVGFPFSIANFRQQSGRAGRRENPSLTVLIGGSEPVDQHYMSHPSDIISEKVPDTLLNLDNQDVLIPHLQCAAYEMPLAIETDGEYFDVAKGSSPEEDSKNGDDSFSAIVARELTPILEEEGFVFYGPATEYMPYPASMFSLRSIGKGNCKDENTFAVVDITSDKPTVIERLDDERVPFTLYQGAIFLFQGDTYLIESLEIPKRYALAKKIKANYITKSRDYVDVDPFRTMEAKSLDCSALQDCQDASASCGLVNENSYIFGFNKFGKGKAGGYSRIIESVEIAESQKHMFRFQAPGVWINLPSEIMKVIMSKKLSPAASIHAAEHAILSLIPILYMDLNPDSLFTECKAPAKEFKKDANPRRRPAQLIFYESVNKIIATQERKRVAINSTGIMKKMFDRLPELLNLARNRVEECKECVWGCPSCVASSYCREESIIISKPGALLILRFLCNVPLDKDNILNGPECNLEHKETGQTIIF